MALILTLDQITKQIFLNLIREHGTIELLPFFNLVLVFNKGVSFGMFAEANARHVLIAFTLVMIVILSVWLFKEKHIRLRFALAAVIAGAIGNVIDRIFVGAVIDFLDFHAFGWHYPAFNIADSSIVLGIAYLLFDSLFLEPKRQNQSIQSNETDKEIKSDENTDNNA